MSTLLVFNNGSRSTVGNAVTLVVNAQGQWLENAGATRYVTGVVSTLAQGEALGITLTKASSTMPDLQYTLSGSGWQGQVLPGGNFFLNVPRPSATETFNVTAVPPTPPAPMGLTLTVKPQSAQLRAVLVEAAQTWVAQR